MKRSEPAPQTEHAALARLHALLFQGATLGAAILTALAEVKLPKVQGE